ncbi:N(6)-adenine-specific DNA methyltransferase, partial [Lecanoromycetidae sp. Uapishka_2]
MTDPRRSPSAILYQNADKAVTLLDIPRSISLAQGTAEHPSSHQIYASQPLQAPYPSTEPKSDKARENVLRTRGHPNVDFPELMLRQALSHIAEHFDGDWCLQRKTLPSSLERQNKQRESEESAPSALFSSPEPEIRIPEDLLWSRRLSEPLVLSTGSELWSSCTSIRSITNSATAGPGQFDFILLDPPWDNRSVRRSAKYETMGDSDPMTVLRGMLSQHLAPGGLVACWVTNKAFARDTALDAFDDWGVQLVEVWAWLKVTIHGRPVTEIEGLWRKPYELLLVGKRMNTDAANNLNENAQARVLVAVPDLHSRKPNLKELFEPMLPARYRALEVFARNLTAGWWAWGDQVLKHNWEGHWSPT